MLLMFIWMYRVDRYTLAHQKRTGRLGTEAKRAERRSISHISPAKTQSRRQPTVATFKTTPPSFYTSAKMENERGELVDRKDAHSSLELGYGISQCDRT